MEHFGSAALQRLLALRPECVEATHAQFGDATACVAAARVLDVMELMHGDEYARCEMLIDLCAVDHLGRREESGEVPHRPRFEVVYHLFSTSRNDRLRIKAGLTGTSPEIDSVTPFWPAANWMEREVFDLYGIGFRGHPDLRRLLLYDEFQGHPLRKDYPKRGRQPLVGPCDAPGGGPRVVR